MLGNKLMEIMIAQNITYRELSRKSGIAISALYKIANNISDPRQSTMISISRALKMNVTDIFNFK